MGPNFPQSFHLPLMSSTASLDDCTGVRESGSRLGRGPAYERNERLRMAMLLTTKLMLDYLGEEELASRLEAAIARVIREGEVRSYDMGGCNTTLEVAEAISDYL